jgi:hypothetical protein
MNKRLPEAQRLKLEARLQALRDVEMMRKAALEPGKVSGIVDKVSPEQADIKSVVESIMKVMEAEPEVGKYHTANKAKLFAFFKKAMEMSKMELNPDAGENPEEEAMHLKDPAMHMVEDLEHEVQTLDDATLSELVQKLEERMKSDLAKMPGASPIAATSNAPDVPPAAPAPKAEKPPVAEKEEAPEEEESEKEESEDDEKPNLNPEQKMALLLSLPKSKRLAKAASLRALAGVLEGETREVSQDNEINEVNSDPSLMKDYEDEEDGSMKDVKAAKLKATARQLLAALEEDADEKDDKKEDKEMDKEAVLSLALRHLIASVEDMEEAKEDEDEDKKDMKKEARDLDESEGGKPNWLQDAEEKAEAKEGKDEDKEDDKEPSFEERKAILKARLASLKRTATVDGKSMKTPKEVPSPSGTTEDNLKGDAKIQYSTSTGEDGLDVIKDRRDPVKKDKQMAGNDEPNALYMSNSTTKDRYMPTSESDSSKDFNNKRVLKDMGTAVQNPMPSSPEDQMMMGDGSHQKEKSWDKAKSESDTTPSGDRLVGLAQMNEIIKTRTDRAVKLAGKMAELGIIKTEAQLGEKIAELAAMDDSAFKVVASFLSTTSAPARSTRTRTAGEMPPWLEKGKEDEDEDMDDDKEDDDKEEKMDKEASAVRRSSRNDDEDGEVRRASKSTRRAERGGLKTPLMSGTDAIISQRASTISRNGSPLSDSLSKLAWTDPLVEARKKADLDELFEGR